MAAMNQRVNLQAPADTVHPTSNETIAGWDPDGIDVWGELTPLTSRELVRTRQVQVDANGTWCVPMHAGESQCGGELYIGQPLYWIDPSTGENHHVDCNINFSTYGVDEDGFYMDVLMSADFGGGTPIWGLNNRVAGTSCMASTSGANRVFCDNETGTGTPGGGHGGTVSATARSTTC